MATITIGAQIFTGNMGVEWEYERAMACYLRKFSRDVWRSDCAEFIAAGHTVRINIEVQNASGCEREMSVSVSDSSDDEMIALQDAVECALTTKEVIWEMFCDEQVAE